MKYSCKWKTTLTYVRIEDNPNIIQLKDSLNIVANGRQPQKKIMQPKTIEIKTMVVAPLRVT